MKYSEELTNQICEHISKGATNKDAAIMSGIAESTFYKWMEDNTEFSESIKKAASKRTTAILQTILKAAVDHKTWQAGAWYLERTDPEQFARKERGLEVKGDGKIEVIFHDYE
jgi:hypothetical protein